MKNLFLFICFCLLTAVAVNAQTRTWTGAISDNWDDGRNWKEGSVPTDANHVILPKQDPTFINFPQLTHDVTIHSLESYSVLKMNGNSLKTIHNFVVVGGAFINYHPVYPSSLIILNSDTPSDAASLMQTGFWGNINIVLHNGNLYEGENNYVRWYNQADGSYVGNISYVNFGNGSMLLGYFHTRPSKYEGNLLVANNGRGNGNCTVSNAVIAGNFHYESNTSGAQEITGTPGTTTIAGKFDVNIGTSSPVMPDVNISNVSNTATGGDVWIRQASGLTFSGNALYTNEIDVSGVSGGVITFQNNVITATSLEMTDAATNANKWNIMGNVFNTAFVLTKNGSAACNITSSTFNKNASITINNGSYVNGGFVTANVFNKEAAFVVNNSATLGDDNNIPGVNQFWDNAYYTAAASAFFFLRVNKNAYAANLNLKGIRTGIGGIEGALSFNGPGNSILSADAPYTITNLTIAKTTDTAKLMLHTPLTVRSVSSVGSTPPGGIVFTRGKIISSRQYPLTVLLNGGLFTSEHPGNTSYVAGPVTRNSPLGGTYETTPFTFPIGSAAAYLPITISGGQQPIVGNSFTAEYIDQNATDAGYDITKRGPSLQAIATNGYWLISRNYGTRNVNITFTFNTRPGAITSLSKLRVAHWNGSLWEDLGNGGATWIDSARGIGSITTAAPVTSFSPFAIGTTDAAANVLPVTFTTLSAIYKNGHIEVNWATASETNCSHYDIEFSADGKTFTKAGTVASKAINGNSEISIDYRFSFAPSAMAVSALILLPLLLAFPKRRWKGFVLGWLAMSCILIGPAACRKEKEAVATGTPKLFVRIAQVDKDGGVQHSKIIQVGEQ